MSENTAAIFDNVYENRLWGFPLSGGGSSLEATRRLTAKLPEVLSFLTVKSFLDCGCGDLTWIPTVDMTGIHYTGIDISQKAVSGHVDNYPDKHFKVGCICSEPLPEVDLAFSRDVLVHLPFKLIWGFLKRLRLSGTKHLMTTSFSGREENTDCKAGQWRTLNFEAPPFNFPLPLLTVNEQYEGEGGIYRDKSLCVWRVQDIPKH